jgi:hypothetical protein
MKIDGRCHCGYISFEAEAAPEKTAICHCTDCQSSTGSAFRTNIPVPGDAFKLLSGQPAIYVKTADSGNRRAHAFCPKCGSQLYSTSEGEAPRPAYSLRVGTLLERNQFVPQVQNWFRSAQPWVMGIAALPKNEKAAR